MSTTISIGTHLVTQSCCKCGGVYAIGAEFDRERRENGGSWNCPYCRSSWSYQESRVQQLQKQLEAERNRVVAERGRHDQTKARLEETKRSLTAQKAATTRMKNRVAAGTCPCCEQSFEDLASHMQAEHPEFAKSD